MKKLALFAVVICLFIAEAIVLSNFFFHKMVMLSYQYSEKDRELRLTLAMVYFHNYYHTWPCAPGPLKLDVITELGGFKTAQINNQHIDFGKLSGSFYSITDSNGQPFIFNPDDLTGTCSISSVSDN
jgi:hypothetical protein